MSWSINGSGTVSKSVYAGNLLRIWPEGWFRDKSIDDRDRALLSAEPVDFVDYNLDNANFLRSIYCAKQDENFEVIEWNVENDQTCKNMIAQAGGTLAGFPETTKEHTNWLSMKININVSIPECADIAAASGFLSSRPTRTRIFKGPKETCSLHEWDAMIIRDCIPSTDGIMDAERISSRKWDVLLVKMCEDFNYPWVVFTIKDSGSAAELGYQECYAL
ncbi:hypothetical protein F5B20DRAFT_575553 [Whalleya microplaca]|nr:hypothetical protein F5B20DRAFT_575553 [Whalleya microplaca]